jgi:hypothetical protein
MAIKALDRNGAKQHLYTNVEDKMTDAAKNTLLTTKPPCRTIPAAWFCHSFVQNGSEKGRKFCTSEHGLGDVRCILHCARYHVSRHVPTCTTALNQKRVALVVVISSILRVGLRELKTGICEFMMAMLMRTSFFSIASCIH